MKSTPVAWRTVVVVLVMAGFMLAALFITSKMPNGEKFFEHAVGGFILLAAIAASKSAVEHLATGGGLRGVAKVLMTDAKPGIPAPPQQGETK